MINLHCVSGAEKELPDTVLRPGLSHGHRSPRTWHAVCSLYSELRCIPARVNSKVAIYRRSMLYLQFVYLTTGWEPQRALGDVSYPLVRSHLESGEGSRKCAIPASDSDLTSGTSFWNSLRLRPAQYFCRSWHRLFRRNSGFAYWRWSELQP